jgi:hypothetical protein
MPDALDPLPLLRALHEHGVEYIVVGGFAVNAHGFIRVTHLRTEPRGYPHPENRYPTPGSVTM